MKTLFKILAYVLLLAITYFIFSSDIVLEKISNAIDNQPEFELTETQKEKKMYLINNDLI